MNARARQILRCRSLLSFSALSALLCCRPDERNCGDGCEPDVALRLAAVANPTLPEPPVLLRDVHLVEDDGTGAYHFTHPTVPAFRKSNDGRVAVDLKKRGGNVAFYLYAPEREAEYPQSWTAGVRMEATTEAGTLGPYPVAETEFHGSPTGYTHWHTTICDPGGTPTTCPSPAGDDCYALEIYTVIQPAAGRGIDLWKKAITVSVANPKTPAAYIRDIDVSAAPTLARAIPDVNKFFEPAFTADGRLLVARVNGKVLELDGFMESTELVYLVDPDAVAPHSTHRCDIADWSGLHRISWAPNDPNMTGRYGIADQPMRDPENNTIPPGRDLRVTYPWIDAKGNNVFFTTVGAMLYYWDPSANAVRERYPASCIASQPGCTEPILEADLGEEAGHEYADNTRGVGFAGRWSNGKVVLLDNRINNTDYGLPRDEPHQRMLQLYAGPSVRVGAGRDNGNSGAPPGSSLNATVLDSLENLFNHDPHAQPSSVRDVVWRVNTGKASAEVAFDDYVDPDVVVHSDMSASLTWDGNSITDRMKYWDGFDQTTPTRGTGFPAQPLVHLQNSATTSKWITPPYGALLGGARIEPVALGGIAGKGVWLDGRLDDTHRDRIEYRMSDQLTQPSTWYAALFVDPRFPDDGLRRRVLTFPDGTRISLDGLASLVLRSGPNRASIPLPAGLLPQAAWSHLGFVFAADSIDVYLNGYLLESTTWGVTHLIRAGTLAAGGRPSEEPVTSSVPPAFRGWLDELVLIAGEPNPEVLCNHARGTLIGWNAGAPHAAPYYTAAEWNDVADRYPASSHAALSARLPIAYERYACYSDYTSLVEWNKNLSNVPADTHSLRSALLSLPQLHFGSPRPAMDSNTFCLSCHQSAIPSLSLSALTANPIPMQDDRRRQPMQPRRHVTGNIPAQYVWRNALPSAATTAVPPGAYLDQWVYP